MDEKKKTAGTAKHIRVKDLKQMLEYLRNSENEFITQSECVKTPLKGHYNMFSLLRKRGFMPEPAYAGGCNLWKRVETIEFIESEILTYFGLSTEPPQN